MVTSSPFPTCSSPSQVVSIDAGLKSSATISMGEQELSRRGCIIDAGKKTPIGSNLALVVMSD